MSFETVLIDKPDRDITRITLNRPEARNAQSVKLLYELNAAFDMAARDGVPAQSGALQTAAEQHLRVGYYIGNLAIGITKKQPLTLGSGTYEAAPVPGGQRFDDIGLAVVKLLSGPGT